MIYDFEGAESEVILARCSSTELAIDWIEEGVGSGLEAKSTDGIIFEGRYYYKDNTPSGRATLRLYRAKDDWLLLIGSWDEDGSHEVGHWVFQLQPKMPLKSKRK